MFRGNHITNLRPTPYTLLSKYLVHLLRKHSLSEVACTLFHEYLQLRFQPTARKRYHSPLSNYKTTKNETNLFKKTVLPEEYIVLYRRTCIFEECCRPAQTVCKDYLTGDLILKCFQIRINI